MFRVYLKGFRAKVRAARANVSDGQYKKLVASILKKSNKVSAAEKKAIIDDVAKCVKGEMKSYAAEEVSGFDPTALMGGKVKLVALKKGEGHEPLVDEEMLARKIPTEMEEFVKDYGEDADLGTVPFLEKKGFLKLHEAKREAVKNQRMTLEDHRKKTNAIVPESDGLMAFLMAQHQTSQAANEIATETITQSTE